MRSLTDIRDRVQQHENELDRDTKFYSPEDLAKRWGVAVSTVRAIPFSELPFIEFGQGSKRKLRRYHPAAVEAYEAARMAKALERRSA